MRRWATRSTCSTTASSGWTGCMADDLSVVNGARVSFASRVEEMTEREEGLIRFLMRERHGTPFEHNSFRFHIKCPIFVAAGMDAAPVSSFQRVVGRATRSSSPSSTCPPPRTCGRRSASRGRTRSTRSIRRAGGGDARGAAGGVRAGVRDVRALLEQGRRQGDRPQRAAGRDLHAVLLDGQRPQPDELLLAAQRRDGPAGDPPLRRGRRAVLRRRDAGHPRRVRRQRAPRT